MTPTPQTTAPCFGTLDQLARWIAETLASLEMLKADQFRLTQQPLYRQGQPCGMYYCLQGPRALSLSAVWETQSNTVLFYGSSGQRVQRIRLHRAPELAA